MLAVAAVIEVAAAVVLDATNARAEELRWIQPVTRHHVLAAATAEATAGPLLSQTHCALRRLLLLLLRHASTA